MEQLRGKVAVVTGGASGIGLAMARAFADEGMRLVLADIEPEPLAAASAELAATGAEVVTTITDVADGAQVDALAASAREAFGTVHVVCNNAGVGTGGTIWELTEADWTWVLGVNLWGVIHGVRAFVPMLVEQGEGHVVNTASVAGLISAPMMGPYNVSKHGVVTLTETLFSELQMRGSQVGCSVLCPSWVNTRIFESGRNRPDDLQNPPDSGPDFLTGNEDVARQFLSSAMPAEEVARKVVDAVKAKTFYILTHGDTEAAVRSRFEGIEARDAPRSPFFPV